VSAEKRWPLSLTLTHSLSAPSVRHGVHNMYGVHSAALNVCVNVEICGVQCGVHKVYTHRRVQFEGTGEVGTFEVQLQGTVH